jgi:hypothetical protein
MKIRTTMVVVTVFVASMIGLSGNPASAAPARLPALSVQAPQDVNLPAEWPGHTFDHSTTYAIWHAAMYGDLMAFGCSAWLPSELGFVCDLLQSVAATLANLGEPADNECLRVYLAPALPPTQVTYVDC